VTAKGRPLVPRFDATTLSNGELIDLLTADGWARDAARRVLVERGIDEVGPDLDTWASAARRAAPGTAGYHRGLERRCLELLWLRQGLDDGTTAAIDAALLSRVLTSPDPRARAAATRVVVDWADRLREPGVGPDGSLGPLDLLAPSVDDENAAVRLEGVRALAAVGRRLDPASPEARRAAALALHVVDHPRDDALDYAVWLAARDLEPAWLPALLAGGFDDGGKIARVLFAIRAAETTAASGWMMEQWQQAKIDGAKLTGADIDALLHAIALLGTAAELRAVFDVALAATTPAARSASLLSHLAESQRKRKVAPAGDLAGLTRLLTSPDAALESAAVDAAGAWQVEAAAGPLERIAADADRPLPRREAACRALGNLPGKAAHDALATLAAAPSTPEPLVAASLAALATRSLDEAAALTSGWLARGPGEAAIHEVLRAFLGTRGGADRLAIPLADVTLPAPTLRAVLQDVTAAGRPEPALTAALERAGASDTHPSITPQERAGILQLVADGADAGRGRELYRREALRCVACHRIDREGGRVGPNLTAIGSAAQPDYLLDALLEPAKSVKEGYGSLVVVTTDGQVTSGIPVSRSDTELVLRTALDREVRLQLADIDEEAPGTSLMPAGLVDGLSAAEIADLVRYLSSLGR
jgi:putative heme-binding domain-containing protein